MRSLSLIPAIPVIAALAVVAGAPASAEEFFVSSASELSSVLSSLDPGDTVIMTDGTWTNQDLNFSADGTSTQPITLRAQTPGQVILNGSSRLSIGGTHLVVDGLRFEGGALSSGNVIEFRRGSNEAEDCRLTNTAIINYNPSSINTRYFWVSMYGKRNRVDHCYFEGQNHSGVTLVIWGDWPNDHRIDNNFFAGRPEGNGNGFETVRVGTSQVSSLSSGAIFESNLFRDCDGEIEIISNKTADNTYRYNTFRANAGKLTLRHGERAMVHGNFFFGDDKDSAGGIRVINAGHRIWNNHFQNLDGRSNGIIVLEAGQPNADPSGYDQVDDVIIAHNTVVNCGDSAVKLDQGFGDDNRTLLPINTVIANTVLSVPGELVFDGNGPGVTYQSVLADGAALGIPQPVGILVLPDSPLEEGTDGLFRTIPTGFAANQLFSTFPFVTDDMDGQPRVSLIEIGADELAPIAGTRAPLEPEDVGPAWLNQDPVDPPTGSTVIQAEDATQFLDPDNDGGVYTIITPAGAFGTGAIVAPSGDRVELPNEDHDTIAVYTVSFPEPGPYFAYYRARGFSSSTDSFFRPAAFGVDPDINEGTTSNGSFRWETGEALTVGSAQAGQPLEFRIGMREGGCEIDAIVFHPDGNLTATELDALASADPNCPADVNDDGAATPADFTSWLQCFNNPGAEPFCDRADVNGDGSLTPADFTAWLEAFNLGC